MKIEILQQTIAENQILVNNTIDTVFVKRYAKNPNRNTFTIQDTQQYTCHYSYINL